MRIALVHDYIREYGGAERVLEVLSEMYPDAPIYTSFADKKSFAYEHFKNRKIIESWVSKIPFFPKLVSPLRFLTPFIRESFDFSDFDIVISSASWYITKGFGTRGTKNKKPVEICYCHTPPRWLYGYNTSVNFKKYALVRLYGKIVGFFLRKYDYDRAQKVNIFLANSKEVQERIKRFYKRESAIVYPPVSLPRVKGEGESVKVKQTKNDERITNNYYFIVSRLVGGKGIELAIEASRRYGFKLKIAGSKSGYYKTDEIIKQVDNDKKPHPNPLPTGDGDQGGVSTIEFLDQVTDSELVDLYKNAKAFFALSKDEDFGITPVEAMLCGTPVIAFNGGGYKETVVNNKTGILFDDYSIEGLNEAMEKLESLRLRSGKKLSADCINQAKKFSKEEFVKNIKEIISNLPN